jgi:hypothetical protein
MDYEMAKEKNKPCGFVLVAQGLSDRWRNMIRRRARAITHKSRVYLSFVAVLDSGWINFFLI